MNLTAKQLGRIQYITDLIQKYYGRAARAEMGNEGGMIYTLEDLDMNGDVMLSCVGADLRFYETCFMCYVIISKHGGIKAYNGNMLPKLVLPATPRLCTYNDPYKKSK